ncbi:MAG: carboxypeptidase regulatory-like domain-containing protein [Candidatus Hatepunaea meridiana]|nr:carboxypeptidase regulatory-like domain-containing protein [Candidatus Hatepunaea meridiana]
MQKLFILLFLALFLALPAFAQTGSVSGRVFSGQRPVSNADVIIENDRERFETQTDREGAFAFERVPVGRYGIVASHDDFGRAEDDLEVNEDENTEIDLVLDGGGENRPPVLFEIGNWEVEETEELTFTLEALDPDHDNLEFSARNLPEGAELNGADFVWTPNWEQAGNYEVTFIVTDDGEGNLTDEETITISVSNRNRPPVLFEIGDWEVEESEELAFALRASDPDDDDLVFSAENLPEGAEFTDNGDGTAEFGWTPDNEQAGNYDVTFIVTDATLTDEETITISVSDGGGGRNRPPVLAHIGDREVDEEQILEFTLEATDPDDDDLAFFVENPPESAEFTDNGDGTAVFIWTPDNEQAGDYEVTFIVMDGNLTDEETITITVIDNDDDEFGSVSGTVSTEDDEPAVNADVIIEIGERETLETQTDDRGGFAFEEVPVGNYRITALLEDVGTAEDDIEIVADQETMVILVLHLEGVGEQGVNIPVTSVLLGSFPNPFNAVATVSYNLPAATHVRLSVFNTEGRLIQTLSNGWIMAGEHQTEINGYSLPTGIYILRLDAGKLSQTKRLVLLK